MAQPAPSAGDFFAPPPANFPATPRTVRLRFFRYRSLLVALLFAGIGVCMCLGFVAPPVLTPWTGTIVPGRISDKSVTGRRGNTFQVTIDYQVDVQHNTSRIEVTRDSFDQLKIGDPVQVRYLPIVPGVGIGAMLEEPRQPTSWSRLFLIGFILLGTGFTFVVVYRFCATVIGRRHLARFGVPTNGCITGKHALGRSPRHRRHRVTFRYKAPQEPSDGPSESKEHEGTMSIRARDYVAAQVGQAVTVLYDPAKPENCIIYCFGEFQIVGV